MALEKVEPLSTILIKAGAKRVLKDLVSNSTSMRFQFVNSSTWSKWLSACVYVYSLLALSDFPLTIYSVSPHMNV